MPCKILFVPKGRHDKIGTSVFEGKMWLVHDGSFNGRKTTHQVYGLFSHRLQETPARPLPESQKTPKENCGVVVQSYTGATEYWFYEKVPFEKKDQVRVFLDRLPISESVLQMQ